MQLYGIPNCDTVKKARALLGQAQVPHQFNDFKKRPPAIPEIQSWARQVGWEVLLNKAGSTWRALAEAERDLATDEAGTIALLATHPSLIKRPVAVWPDGAVTVGLPALQRRVG